MNFENINQLVLARETFFYNFIVPNKENILNFYSGNSKFTFILKSEPNTIYKIPYNYIIGTDYPFNLLKTEHCLNEILDQQKLSNYAKENFQLNFFLPTERLSFYTFKQPKANFISLSLPLKQEQLIKNILKPYLNLFYNFKEDASIFYWFNAIINEYSINILKNLKNFCISQNIKLDIHHKNIGFINNKPVLFDF